MITHETLPPNYAKLDKALRSIGYNFEVAVADIVDNALDAHAHSVLIRFVIKPDDSLNLLVMDDGDGMDETTLREAMRFGANVSEHISRLGKFGLGLKLASLSQARELRVYTAKRGQVCGRGWLEEGVTKGFTSSVFSQDECITHLHKLGVHDQLGDSGTVIFWSSLYRVGRSKPDPEEHVQRLMQRLREHLGIAFHRFLDDAIEPLHLTIDMIEERTLKSGIPIFIRSLNPFAYNVSGHKAFPARLLVEGYDDLVSVTGHIWPANSKQSEYRLPGGANSRQGLYFYRNNRLIQGGGWNGIREIDPHLSLARVSIDLSPKFDVDISLDVKKIEVQLPPDLVTAILSAKTNSGLDFKKFLTFAQNAYRSRSALPSEIPLALGAGIPKKLQKKVVRELNLEKQKKLRRLSFQWRDFEDSSLFEVDRGELTIFLNRAYRRSLLHGLDGSSTDIPVTKCLLFYCFATFSIRKD